MKILDGKAIAFEIQKEIANQIATLPLNERKPCLAVVMVGDVPASEIYVSRKTRACEEVGIKSIRKKYPSQIKEDELLSVIFEMNLNPEIDGILVQLPLPSHINPSRINQALDPKKDVDGFHPINLGKLLMGNSDGFFPCTPHGIQVLLQKSGIEIAGKHVVILGRSNIVGKPMAALLMQNAPDANATVTVVHSQTKNLSSICQMADILIVAIGKPLFLKKEMVKPGAVIVDVGINQLEDSSKSSGYKLVGDVDTTGLETICSAISPVPGGVGPMTIAMLLHNTLKSYLKKRTI